MIKFIKKVFNFSLGIRTRETKAITPVRASKPLGYGDKRAANEICKHILNIRLLKQMNYIFTKV